MLVDSKVYNAMRAWYITETWTILRFGCFIGAVCYGVQFRN